MPSNPVLVIHGGAWAIPYDMVQAHLNGVRNALAAGWRVLDLCAGTGVACRAALAAGARSVVCADSAPGMLRWCEARLHPVAADVTALPLRDRSFDLALAAFCLGHLDRPVAGLREARRVAASLAASSFAAGWNHPAKAAVDEVLGAFGYRPPPWYVTFKRDTEPWASDPAALRRDTTAAGFTHVRLRTVTVDTTANRAVGVGAAWGTSNASNTITTYNLMAWAAS